MSVQYTGGCSVHQGITLSNCGSVHRGDIMNTLGVFSALEGTMSTLEGTMSTLEGCHECGDIISTLGDVQYTGVSIQTLWFYQ